MTLIVEDGTGLDTAESLVSVAEADAYHIARGNEDWIGGPAGEAALRRASSYIEGRYGARWKGYRTNSTQALGWPRSGVYLSEVYGPGYYAAPAYASNAVPREVKAAVAEAALLELLTPGTLNPVVRNDQRILSETVGPLSTTYAEVSGSVAARPVVTIINDLLAPWLSGTANSARVVRG